MKNTIKIASIGLIFILNVSFLNASQGPLTGASIKGLDSKNVKVTEEIEVASNKNVIDILAIAFPIFYSHIKRAHYAPAIADSKAITIFAPTDQAFTDLQNFIGKEAYNDIFNKTYTEEGMKKIRKVMRLHIVPDRAMSYELMQMKSIQPYGSRKLNFKSESGIIKINDTTTVVEADIVGTNGVVHAIDAVIMP